MIFICYYANLYKLMLQFVIIWYNNHILWYSIYSMIFLIMLIYHVFQFDYNFSIIIYLIQCNIYNPN